jgi:hypothetical protein
MVLCLSLVSCLAVSNALADEGTYALDFLSLGVGARALGMGGAYAALADDATAAYWNPAGLCDVPSRAFTAQHADLFQQGTDSLVARGLAQHNYANVVLPFENGAKIALSWTRVAVDDIPRVTFVDVNGDGVLGTFLDKNLNGKKDPDETYLDTPIIAEMFANTDDAYSISYARRLSESFSVGGSAKLVRQALYASTGTGFGVDLGATYRYGRYARIALVVQDATGTRVRWNTSTRPTFVRPANARLGVSGTFPFRHWLRLNGSADVDLGKTTRLSEADGASRLHLGGELTLAHLVAFRIGSDAGHFTAGAGFRVPVRSAAFHVDYAFTTHPDLGDAQRLSMTGFF